MLLLNKIIYCHKLKLNYVSVSVCVYLHVLCIFKSYKLSILKYFVLNNNNSRPTGNQCYKSSNDLFHICK